MTKKILSGILMIFIVGNIYNISYSINNETAKNIETVSNEDYNLTLPEENLVTKESTVLVSGKAKENSDIYISVYSSDDLFHDKKILWADSVISIDENPIIIKEIEVGGLERYNVELELPIGRNNIIIQINNGEDNYVFNRNINITSEIIAEKYLSNTKILRDRDMMKLFKLKIEKNRK